MKKKFTARPVIASTQKDESELFDMLQSFGIDTAKHTYEAIYLVGNFMRNWLLTGEKSISNFLM